MHNDRQISDVVVEIIASTIKINKEVIHKDSILDELGMDSVLFIESVMRIEEVFSIVFEDDSLVYSKFIDVKSLIEYVQQRC